MSEKVVAYLKHDANARNDPKISKLRSAYKWEGYGIYWAICEILREQSDFTYPLDFEALAEQLHCKSSKIEKLVSDCIHEFKDRKGRGLFESDGVCFWSNRAMEDAIHYEDVREKRRTAARNKPPKE